MTSHLALPKLPEGPQPPVAKDLPAIAYTVRHHERPRYESHKILQATISSRSKSQKCLTTVTPAAESASTKALNMVSLEKNFLPRIKRLAQLKKPQKQCISEVVSLLLRLPHTSYLAKSVSLPKPLGYKNKKTLVLDLDETLVHACKNQTEGHVKIQFSENYHKFINIRPYVQDLLKYACQEFEVVIFTASNKKYADAVLAHLDPTNKWIHHRLYRDSCIEYRGYYIKDLRILLNRDLKDVIIVDNSMVSFALQLDNGVPIHAWTEDLKDFQLRLLIDYLKVVRTVSDVRKVNRDIFNLSRTVDEAMKNSNE